MLLHRYDVDKSQFIDFMELKLMMEKLGEPQTHLALKEMIKAVDEDHDNQISFREVRGQQSHSHSIDRAEIRLFRAGAHNDEKNGPKSIHPLSSTFSLCAPVSGYTILKSLIQFHRSTQT